jgi:hypothetical protein
VFILEEEEEEKEEKKGKHMLMERWLFYILET